MTDKKASKQIETQIETHITDDNKKKIKELFNKTDVGKEFEFIFFSKKGHNMNKEKYVLLLKYIKGLEKAKKHKVLPPEKSLDIGYKSDSDKTYRVSVTGSSEINKIMDKITSIQNINYVIYKFLLFLMAKDDDKISFMTKTKKPENTIDLDDLNIRVRLSDEDDILDQIKKKKYKNLDSKLDENIVKLLTGKTLDADTRADMNNKVFFRLKERTSVIIEETDKYYIRLDLTDTKTSTNVHKLFSTYSNYELEIEYGAKKAGAGDIGVVYETSERILKLLQQSSFIIGETQKQKVLQYYKDIANITGNISNLVARQPVSLEIQHVTEILPNRYTVTDKADGDRYFLIIYNNGVYLISGNLNVKDTGIVLDKKQEKYNGTLLDGEYIYLPRERRHLFMVFDALRCGDEDLRNIININQRLEKADEVIKECFIFKGQTGFIYKSPPQQKGEFNVDEVSEFYGNELKRFHEVLNKDIQVMKEYLLVRRKFFMQVYGAQRWEIFKYSTEYWKRYSEDSSVKFPYALDGLIYHPLEQIYTTNLQESKYSEYKWKPPHKNSMDFYIEFKRDSQTGKILNVYDNSLANDNLGSAEDELSGSVRNKVYNICTLYVGKTVNDKEMPVPFDQNYGIAEAYIYKKDNEVRDETGDIISDKTVVEFYYKNDPDIIPQHRWTPIKTRYDKTESVERHGKRYGNYITTAERIWRSIINPVLMEDMIELSKGDRIYDRKMKELNAKISHQLIVAVNRENKYTQKVARLNKVMQQFHNFIKSSLIYTYCNKMYESNTQQSVLDIQCGRGVDINKYYYTEVAYYVGIDIDAEGLKSPVDGAISRYERMRRKKPNFPKMYYIQADARSLLDYDSQIKSISGMSEDNKKLINKFFESGKDTLFDRINCQFALQMFLKDDLTWSNFKTNVKKHLRNGGYLITSCFDAKQVNDYFGDGDKFMIYYDDSDGNKKVFFEMTKKYTLDKKKTGNAIDIHEAWKNDEGVKITEYLVDLEFIKEELERDADLELLDTDLFANQYEIHRRFISDAAHFESSEETRKYMSNVEEYYENTEMNKKCVKYTNLHRYYIFRKKEPTNKKQKGGGIYDFSDNKKFKVPVMMDYDSEYSIINSIHKILISHSIIPKTLKVENFMDDLGVKLMKDHDINEEYLGKLCKKLTINHEIEGGKMEKVIDGVNIFFVERDCNNFYDISYVLNKNKSERAVILMKEGELYKPILRKENEGIRGVYKMKDDMMRYLIDNGQRLK